MYLGDVVELGPIEDTVKDPMHPYTQALSSAVPVPDPVLARKETKVPLKSFDVPSPIEPPPGCKFHPRCPYAMEKCSRIVPELRNIREGHQVACHLY